MRTAVLALLAVALLAAAPAVAAAAPTVDVQLANREVQYGQRHELSGTLLNGIVPLAGQQVVLEVARPPFAHRTFASLGSTTTDAQGHFAFAPKLDRNAFLRVFVPALGLRSRSQIAYTLPAFTLSFRARRAGVIRLTQTYTVPRSVRLKARTLFYLGRRHALRSSLRVGARTDRVKAGRFRARATVTLPKSWHGRFRYGSCFPYTHGSYMGDPHASCPKRFRF